MRTSHLFGIKFALKFRYKAQLIEDFKRWKRAKQYQLADDRNKKKLFERMLRQYLQQHPTDGRSLETIADEVWDKLLVEVAKTNWQQVYETRLGKDMEQPRDQVSHHISREHTKELFRERSIKGGDPCTHFYFTESAVEECEKVHITEFDTDWLRDAPDDKRQLNWGDHFIRYEKKDNRIIATAASFTRRQQRKYLLHSFFVFDLNAPKVQYDAVADLVKDQCEKDGAEDETRKFEEKMRALLYKMITFLDLIPLKKIALPKWGCLENESSDEVKKAEPVYNNQNIPLTVVTVTANWNASIYIEQTEVKDYHKNVLCGKGKTKIVRRFIKGHTRKQHTRVAGKLRYLGHKNTADANKVVQMKHQVAAGSSNLSVAQKPAPSTVKDLSKTTTGARLPKQQESLNEFEQKLAELKKKFNRTG